MRLTGSLYRLEFGIDLIELACTHAGIFLLRVLTTHIDELKVVGKLIGHDESSFIIRAPSRCRPSPARSTGEGRDHSADAETGRAGH